jgi:uncharacterized protein (DUF2252 family)
MESPPKTAVARRGQSGNNDPVAAGTRNETGNVVAHLTAQERVERGRSARRAVPRSSHADYSSSSSRPDPVGLLEQQATSRIAELVPIRYGRMLVSPFTFYRGAALLMASDLAGTPSSGLITQVCGDAHLLNFGIFASPERRMIFGLNDFDETLPGPWEWDVKRLAASFAIAGRDNGFSARQRRVVLLTLMSTYREAMRSFAGMTNLAVWYASLDVEPLFKSLAKHTKASAMKRGRAAIAKARTKDSMESFGKLTHMVDGQPRIISAPPLIQPAEELLGGVQLGELQEWVSAQLRSYRQTLQNDRRHLLEGFQLTHIARKVVGVGSVGTRAWVVLLMGRDQNDPLFLQVKEAQQSVLEEFVGPSSHTTNGERVVNGQHLMQAESDIFLGWSRTKGLDGITRDYYYRQLKDWKGSASIEAQDPAVMASYARVCAWTLARAHARSGDRIAMASYLGGSDEFDRAIAEFSETYADQNERDFDALVRAENEGRVTAKRGV